MAELMTYTVSIALITGVIFIVLKLFQGGIKLYTDAVLLNKIPQNPKSLIWGHLLEFPGLNEAGLQYLRDMAAKHSKCFLLWLGPFIPMILVSHPETVKDILKTTEPKAEKAYSLGKDWLGDGLLLSSGKKWARNRRLLTPAFHFEVLKSYVAVKNKAADILLAKIERYAQKEEYFEVFSLMSLLALDVILKCAFSIDSDCQNIGEKHMYVNAVNRMTWISVQRFLKPWLHNDWLFYLTPSGREFRKCCDYVHKVAEDAIDTRRKTLMSGGIDQYLTRRKRCLDFLDILLTAQDETGEGLTKREIRDEADNFMFAGHDTNASALSWTLYSLAENPECQDIVYREVEELMSHKNKTEIEMKDLSELPYLTMCIKESLRLHTPIPVITREATQVMTIGDHKIPAGTMIGILLYSLHHNPEVWQDSLEFRPERFSPENCETRDPFAFLPFAAGPRNCIGQNFAMNNMKIVLVKLIYRFRFELDKNQKVRKRIDAVMKAEDGIRMKAIPRDKTTNH